MSICTRGIGKSAQSTTGGGLVRVTLSPRGGDRFAQPMVVVVVALAEVVVPFSEEVAVA
jgi:hypothetical protein